MENEPPRSQDTSNDRREWGPRLHSLILPVDQQADKNKVPNLVSGNRGRVIENAART